MRAVTVYRVDYDSNTGYRTRHPISSVAVHIVIDVSQARQAYLPELTRDCAVE